MARRAVVVGSQVGALSGVHNDTREMTSRLEQRGFEVISRVGDDATREGILQGFEEIVQKTTCDDAAVFYYSGHGAYYVRPGGAAAEAGALQCIVPVDWERAGEFRGILDLELSLWLEKLTDRTPNVSVILDCCHSSRLAREASDFRRLKALTRSWNRELSEFLAKHRYPALRWRGDSNPKLIRLAAAEQDRYAFEDVHTLAGRELRMGNLSHALVSVLDEAGEAPLSWRSVYARVRELVMQGEPAQRPELAGRSDRLLFSMARAEGFTDVDAVVFFLSDGQPALRAGRMLGAVPGARYDVLSRDASSYEDDAVLAQAEVTSMIAGGARVALSKVRKGGPRPGDLAIPTQALYPRLGIEAIAGTELREKFLREIAKSRYLVHDANPSVRIRAAQGELWLEDATQIAITKTWPEAEESIAGALKVAERWSRATALRAHLPSGDLPAETLYVEWGRVDGLQRVRLTDGAELRVGDSIYLTVSNRSDLQLWVGVFDVGVTGNVSLLTDATPNGRILQPRGQAAVDSFTVGIDSNGTWLELGWPEDGPRLRCARPEQLIVLASVQPVDFSTFTTPSSLRRGTGSRGLAAIFAMVAEGATRDTLKKRKTDRYCQRTVEFNLLHEPESASSVAADVRGVLASSGRREDYMLKRLCVDDLLPGDVLLSMGRSDVSDAIHALDGGWYSHAALWSGEDVIESTDPCVLCQALPESLSSRLYLDVYRHVGLDDAQRTAVVAHARSFVGRDYGYGDLLLGATIIASGSFFFRASDRAQRSWLRAMNLLRRALEIGPAERTELVTCSELVARSYHEARAALTLDISGLRAYHGSELAKALRNMASSHIPLRKGNEPQVLRERERFEQFYEALWGPIQALLPSEGPTAKSFASVLRAGENWSPNLVTPRDLMQSAELKLLGALHP